MFAPARAARSLSILALLAAGCTVVSATPAPPAWDGSTEGGTTGSTGGGGHGSSGFPVTDASACQPGDVATYQPAAYVPASGAYQGACVPSAALADPIGAFYDACLGPDKTVDGCNAFRTANAACAACLVTADTATSYGPVIDHGAFVTANIAGCLELADASALPCARAVQALAGCELAACEANCPVHDTASLAAFSTCSDDAEAGGCIPYASAAVCAESLADASPDLADCVIDDFLGFYQAVAPRFCGAAPDASSSSDAGGD